MVDLGRMLKALADPTRLRIVRLLNGRDELCVCEIVDALEVPQYSVSRHLGVLKAAGVVADWRQGKWMHYALDSKLSDEERDVVRSVCARAERETTARRDRRRLEQSLRPREEGGMIQCP
jgi:ArsR family transcriptional regulator